MDTIDTRSYIISPGSVSLYGSVKENNGHVLVLFYAPHHSVTTALVKKNIYALI